MGVFSVVLGNARIARGPARLAVRTVKELEEYNMYTLAREDNIWCSVNTERFYNL